MPPPMPTSCPNQSMTVELQAVAEAGVAAIAVVKTKVMAGSKSQWAKNLKWAEEATVRFCGPPPRYKLMRHKIILRKRCHTRRTLPAILPRNSKMRSKVIEEGLVESIPPIWLN